MTHLQALSETTLRHLAFSTRQGMTVPQATERRHPQALFVLFQLQQHRTARERSFQERLGRNPGRHTANP